MIARDGRDRCRTSVRSRTGLLPIAPNASQAPGSMRRLTRRAARHRNRRQYARGNSPMSCACNHDGVRGLAKSVRRQARRFVLDHSANTIVTFTLILPVLVAAAGMAVDY